MAQVFSGQEREHLLDFLALSECRSAPETEGDILRNVQMRKERWSLRDELQERWISSAPLRSESMMVERDCSLIRVNEAGDGTQECAFACAGRTEQDGRPGGDPKGDIQEQRTDAMPNFYRERGRIKDVRHSAWRRTAVFRRR